MGHDAQDRNERESAKSHQASVEIADALAKMFAELKPKIMAKYSLEDEQMPIPCGHTSRRETTEAPMAPNPHSLGHLRQNPDLKRANQDHDHASIGFLLAPRRRRRRCDTVRANVVLPTWLLAP